MTSFAPPLFILFGAISIAIGMYVLFQQPQRQSNRAFFLFSFGIALWIGGFGLFIITHAQAFTHVLNFGGLLLVIGVTWFALAFPQPTRLALHPLVFWSPLVLGGSALLLTDSLIAQVSFSERGTMTVTHGAGIIAWSLLLLSYVAISIYILVRRFMHADRTDRVRLWLVYTGIIVFVLSSIIFDAILPALFGITSLNYLGPLASLFFLVSAAYAIVRHEFLDIRLVIQRSLIYSLSFFLLTTLYVTALLFLQYIFQIKTNIAAPLSAGIVLFLGVYSLPYLEMYFRKVTDRWFFKDGYDYFSVLEELSDILNKNLSLRPLVMQSLTVLNHSFKPTYAYFLRSGQVECFSHDNCTCTTISEHRHTDEVQISIQSHSIPIGSYVLGPRRSGDPYTREDLLLLRAFGNNATVAFEKAELHQKLREYTNTLEEKVEERTLHLQKLQAHQREFFDDVSHALQTPLTVLKSGLELLRNPEARLSNTCAAMDRSIDDVSRLIHSILHLARIDTHVPINTGTGFNLSELVERLVEYVEVIATNEGISLSSSIQPDLYIYGHAAQIEEAITNVVSNAVKYTSGRERKEIQLLVEAREDEIHITIKDTGIGMSASELEHIFDRFYRAPANMKHHKGFGIGLAITKRIIDGHAGTIRFESNPDSGSTVLITIPSATQKTDHS